MKKNYYSLLVCVLIAFVLVQYRANYSDLKPPRTIKITTWDALGYYMYLPAMFIYKDVTELKWFPEIDQKYDVSGGWVYQANKHKNGNYVFKYFGGVAIMQAPWFLVGHTVALNTAFEADGFSPPYQYAIGFGMIIYIILSIFLLRHILLRYYDDPTVAITILLLMLASNSIQYVSIDNAQSHVAIFPLYVLLLYTTIKWHEDPKIIWAASTGLVIGLATICRPTEAIMILIPLLWNSETKEKTREKWQMVKQHKSQLYFLALFGLIGILPQLIYWKYASGSFIYDVGSAWDFLTPHFRVLVGWEKGWFIYTPVTIFFVAGLFFIKKYPFRKAVIYFCLANIYIIIAWRIWRYGGSYSTRALVQSYPVFALALAALIQRLKPTKWRYAFYVLGLYLIFVNLFQIWQYNETILHYDHMNRRYYSRIYLNPNPTPLDVSLMDTKDWVGDEQNYKSDTLLVLEEKAMIDFPGKAFQLFLELEVEEQIETKKEYLKIETEILIHTGMHGTYLYSQIQSKDKVKNDSIRLFNPISMQGIVNKYAYYIRIPKDFEDSHLALSLKSDTHVVGEVLRLNVISLTK